jgi:hypothetical protein
VIRIDLHDRLPTDADLKGWEPWTEAQWQAWLGRSAELLEQLSAFEQAGSREQRNVLIDANSAHWGALKPWLLALSQGKCWFSEAKELYSHYDVEHFRPKKEAKALPPTAVRDGYWWLAFDYMNFRVCGNVGNRKKGGWFPLQDGSQSSTFGHQCEEAETPYLLDPVDEYDVSLLAFDEEGKAVAAPGTSAWEVLRVEESVLRLKLNEHVALSEERRKIWQKMDRNIQKYEKMKARYASGNNPAAKERLAGICKEIRQLTDRSSELSAVAKWCVLLRNDPRLAKLVT